MKKKSIVPLVILVVLTVLILGFRHQSWAEQSDSVNDSKNKNLLYKDLSGVISNSSDTSVTNNMEIWIDKRIIHNKYYSLDILDFQKLAPTRCNLRLNIERDDHIKYITFGKDATKYEYYKEMYNICNYPHDELTVHIYFQNSETSFDVKW